MSYTCNCSSKLSKFNYATLQKIMLKNPLMFIEILFTCCGYILRINSLTQTREKYLHLKLTNFFIYIRTNAVYFHVAAWKLSRNKKVYLVLKRRSRRVVANEILWSVGMGERTARGGVLEVRPRKVVITTQRNREEGIFVWLRPRFPELNNCSENGFRPVKTLHS